MADEVILFAQSQGWRVHFKNQHAIAVSEAATLPKSRRLRFVEGPTYCAECRGSLPPDTDSRLLTELSRGRICLRPHFEIRALQIDVR